MTGFSGVTLTALVLAAGMLTLGCGGSEGTPPDIINLAKVSGDAQIAIVGQPLAGPLQVEVTNAGVPSAGTTVTWATTNPGGSLVPSSGATGADGRASTQWTIGTTAGTQSVTASLSGGSLQTFTATALADAAVTLTPAGGGGQSGVINTQLAAPLQAKVADQFGNGVPAVNVGWAATGGTVSAGTVATDAAGNSAVNVTLGGTAGPITITATSGGLTGSPLTFTATATAAPANVAVSVSNNSFSPNAITVPAGTTVVWTWSSGAAGHNVAPEGTVPTRSGGLVSAPATYSFRFDTPGTYRYYCEAHGAPGFAMAGTVTVQ